MAVFETDHLECEKCGKVTFTEKTICTIRKEATKTDRLPQEPLSGRFTDKEIVYECVACGNTKKL